MSLSGKFSKILKTENMYRFPDYILKEILSKTRGKVLDIGTGNGLKLKKNS